jgi:SAM-dependent methyltransferase
MIDKKGIHSKILCPVCHSRLRYQRDKVICTKDAHEFAVENGAILFEKSQDYYWGGWLDYIEMSVMLNEATKTNWLESLNILPNHKTTTIQNIIDERRSVWQFLLPLKERNIALDFGCGMGSISIGLARSFDWVIACDRTKERCQFTVLRGRQEKLDNIIGVVGFRNVEQIPFSSDTFDLLVLYGVLEWVAEGSEGNPQEIQSKFLIECKRVLKKDGILCIAIENATALKYLLGKRDEHAHELRFTTFLPRFISNWISLKVRGKPYMTLIYSYRGYKRLFKGAGFKIYKVYYPVPDYRNFKMLIDLKSSEAEYGSMRDYNFSRLKIILQKIGLFKWLIPSGYLWILKK